MALGPPPSGPPSPSGASGVEGLGLRGRHCRPRGRGGAAATGQRREVGRRGLLLGARSALGVLRGVIRRGSLAAWDEGPAGLAEWHGAAWWGCDRRRQTELAPQ